MTKNTSFLNNRTILVTRPSGREKNLSELIKKAGGQVIHAPVITISAINDKHQLVEINNNLKVSDIAIFISPTAVVETFRIIKHWPETIKIAAIGSKTAQQLEKLGRHVSILSNGHNSESLLQHADLQLNNIEDKNIIIFKGIGGRPLLAKELENRHAKIFNAEIYSRNLPEEINIKDSLLINIDAITISSNEGLNNLVQLIDKNTILSTHLIVPSVKTYNNAKTIGFNHIHLADNATDEACMKTLKMVFNI